MVQMQVGPLWLVKVSILGTVLASPNPTIPIAKNEVRSLDVACDTDSFNTTVILEHPFKGMISAKEFSQECNAFGTMKNTVTLSLPTYGCGLRLTSKKGKNGELLMQYTVTIAIQQDRHLRQIADQEIVVSCKLKVEQFSFDSKSMVAEIENNMVKENNLRNARMRHDGSWNTQLENNKFFAHTRIEDNIKTAKAWMEIVPGHIDNYSGDFRDFLQVGEPAKLIVKSTLPAGIGWKLVDCVAHDGLGDSSQKLLDETGCPVDDQLMPKPNYGPIEKKSLTRYQEASVIFPAFKFPDRDRLHMSCVMLLCRTNCKEIECNKNVSIFDNDRSAKTLSRMDDENILDHIKIFNSVEVLATTINDYYKTEEYRESKA